ncbi:hypothetical protein CEQ90_14445 [Lewinellaceae bacterium SD302]|nr:hypothetical protein CEQ90_14445 [Lewinellaceae bacterium SD302]
MKADRRESQLIRIAIIAVLVLLLLRFVPALWGSLILFALVTIVGVLGYGLYRALSKKTSPVSRDDTLARIENEIAACRHKSDVYRTEAEAIRNRHRRLSDQLEKSKSPEPSARKKAEKILSALDQELGLRLAKAIFFEESEQQLKALLETRKLHQELINGEADLERWRTANYVDVADMEEMKDRIEREKTQLDTISELTHRASGSEDLDHTEALRRKLKNLLG